MRKYLWQIAIGIQLIILSSLLYYLHFKLFHDSHHIFIYLLGDIAFLPIDVLLITLILHNILTIREKRIKMQKLNMVIGTFFSEVGTRLIHLFAEHDATIEQIKNKLIPTAEWTAKDFDELLKIVEKHKFDTEIAGAKLDELRAYVLGKRDFLLGLLANPNLLEHDRFTDVLWAVFHLAEELAHRRSVLNLSQTDYVHLKGDMNRAYSRMAAEWVEYNKHLKDSYPYLFSLSVRTNPFNPSAKIEVT